MCLIAVVPVASDRQKVSNKWLEDVFVTNPDGFGFMYTENGKAIAARSVGKLKEFRKTWRWMESNVEGEFACHLRMRTHGTKGVENAHPYPVDTEDFDNASAYLMHNGVLRTGNEGDRTKSDTWHYISRYLRGVNAAAGELLWGEPSFLRLLGEAIGNNRFVVLGPKGTMHIVNREQGLTWNGMWLSNTYAWDAEGFGAVPRKKAVKTSLLDEWDWTSYRRGQTPSATTPLAPRGFAPHVANPPPRASRSVLTPARQPACLPSKRPSVPYGVAAAEAEDFRLEMLDIGYTEAEVPHVNVIRDWIMEVGMSEYETAREDVWGGLLEVHELFSDDTPDEGDAWLMSHGFFDTEDRT